MRLIEALLQAGSAAPQPSRQFGIISPSIKATRRLP